MTDSTTRPMIFEAVSNVMLDIKHVAKNQVNKQQGFSFRGIDDMYNAVHAAMAKHQIFPTAEVLDRLREQKATKNGGSLTVTVLRVKFTYHAIDGSSVSTEAEGESADSGDKSTSKAMSMADKYALIQMFKIPTSDMPDADKESYILEGKPKITPEQVEDIESRIDAYGIPKTGFNKWLSSMKIQSIDAIPQEMFKLVSDKIDDKKPAAEAA